MDNLGQERCERATLAGRCKSPAAWIYVVAGVCRVACCDAHAQHVRERDAAAGLEPGFAVLLPIFVQGG